MKMNKKTEFKEDFKEVMLKGLTEFGNPNDADKEFMKKHPIYFWCIIFPSLLLPFMFFLLIWTILTLGWGTVQYSLLQGIIVFGLYLVGFIGGFFICFGVSGFLSVIFAKFISDYPESIDDYFTRDYRLKLILIGLGICLICGCIIRVFTNI